MKRARLLSLALSLWLLFGGCAFAQSPAISEVQAIGFTVSDMDRAVQFYSHILHFTKLTDVEREGPAFEHLKGVFGARARVVRMQLGEEQIELSQYLTPKGRPIPPATQSNDRAFQHLAIVVSDMDQAFAWLRENHVEYVSTSPQTLPAWNVQAAGIQAFYFRDPDHHVLEIIHFPMGKGDPRWHNKVAPLFEGVDHTAIVVEDTDKSLAFYQDMLGMRIAGTSENYGVEQEHLNNVFGARLRITSLRAAHGPGIELLEYLVPHTGRPIPADQQANDVAHWEIVVDNEDVQTLSNKLIAAHDHLVSNMPQRLNDAASDPVAALLFQDPDGHVLEAVDKSSHPITAHER